MLKKYRRSIYKIILVFSLHVTYQWINLKHQNYLKTWLLSPDSYPAEAEQRQAKISERYRIASEILKSELLELGVKLE